MSGHDARFHQGINHLWQVRAALEAFGDATPTCLADSIAQVRVLDQPLEVLGERGRIVLVGEESRLPIDDRLDDAVQSCAHDRQAVRHRLQDHVREPILVAVGEPATGQREDVRALVLGPYLALAERPEEDDPITQPKLMDQPLQPRPLRPLAGEP